MPSELEARRIFQRAFEGSNQAYLVLDPRPGLHIVDMTDAYAIATMTTRSAITGRPLFEVFPDNPSDIAADGVANLFDSLQVVCQHLHPHQMAPQRYDVRNAQGGFVEKYWQPANSPLFDEKGNLKFILHHVVDITLALRRDPG